MHEPKRRTILISTCTTMALMAGPALAHDGPHQLTYLQWLLHELAYAGYLPLAPLALAAGGALAWRLWRRKPARNRL